MITEKGRELASSLNPMIGTTSEIEEICSKICRHAVTHHRLQEIACNREMTRGEERQEERIEELITDLVESLPNPDNSRFHVVFQGDPRGVTVKILAEGYERYYNGWALEAIIVP